MTQMDHSNKLTVLNFIYYNRDILFGKFTNNLTHDIKVEKWKEITEQLKAMDIIQKDWKYLRDTTWQNWRKRAVEKRENHLRTGKKCKFDDADELVFKIMGLDSSVSAQFSPPSDAVNPLEFSGTSEEQATSQMQIENTLPVTADVPSYRQPRKRLLAGSTDFSDIKKQKMQVELELSKVRLEIARREKYKLDLELLKLERDLNVPRPSPFTLPILLQGDFKP